jgi:hypothetical protein
LGLTRTFKITEKVTYEYEAGNMKECQPVGTYYVTKFGNALE